MLLRIEEMKLKNDFLNLTKTFFLGVPINPFLRKIIKVIEDNISTDKINQILLYEIKRKDLKKFPKNW